MIETLFPPDVETLVATRPMWSAPLLPEEEACLPPRAVEKRRREYTAGRAAAREVLARFGIRDFPLRAGADRAPVWPAGIVGSLSHCGNLCGVAVARDTVFSGIGLDVEHDRPLEDAILARICSEVERAHLEALPGGRERWAIAMFCAKESVYKCHYPLARTFLDFHDVSIRLDPGAGRFAATIHPAGDGDALGSAAFPRRRLRGRFARNGSYFLAGVVSRKPRTRQQP
jgi:4'-phosphopantetheinyl transferase EntD